VFYHIYIFVSTLIMADDVMDTVEAGRYNFFSHRYCSATFGRKNMATLMVMVSFTMV
jgi:hypothetical protein